MKKHPHMLTAPGDVLAFVLAGDARFTVVSKTTGARYTYRLRTSEDGNITFVGLLTGPDNASSFTYMGVIRERQRYERTPKVRLLEDSPPVRAFTFFWRHLMERKHVHPGLEFWHEGHCGRCGRTLTVPESIERGIGPECATHMGNAA